MDDSEFALFETERIERPTTKRLASTRRPGGPRQALRPVHNIHLHINLQANVDSLDDTDEVPTEHSNPNFDPSCLDALDDQLLSSPIDSFADVCWADAVEEQELESDRYSPTLYNAAISTQHNDGSDSDALIPDKGNCCTDVTEDELHRPSVIYEKEPIKPTIDLYLSQPSAGGIEPLLALWEPHFITRNPNDTVHGFPSRPHKSRRWRKFDLLTNACAHLPGCLVKAAT